MNHPIYILLAGLTCASLGNAQTALKVVASSETLASLAAEIGGTRVEVHALGRGLENPHSIMATPSLMLQVNGADLFIETGLELELWVENLLDGGRNPRVLRGAPGHVVASQGISTLEVPASLSRADGDVHPQGNPHVWLHPLNLGPMAANIAAGLERVDPDGAAHYQTRLADFQQRLDEAFFGKTLLELLGRDYCYRLQQSGGLLEFLDSHEFQGTPLLDRLGGWRKQMLPLRGARLLGYHKTWSYLAAAFDLQIVEHLEPKPGISPTPAHLARLRVLLRDGAVDALVVAPYYDLGKAQALGEEGGKPALALPSAVGGDPEADDVFALFDRISALLNDAVRP